jgi:hypothetical protein
MSAFKALILALVLMGGSGTGNALPFYCTDTTGNRLVYEEGDYAIIVLQDSVGINQYEVVDTLFWLAPTDTLKKGIYCK